MANTLTNMQSRIFADTVVLETNAIVTQLAAFSMGLNREAGEKGDVVRVPVLGTVAADDFDPVNNNYASGGHTDEGVDIPVNRHKVAKAGYTDREFAESPVDYWQGKGRQCSRGLAVAVVEDAFGLVNGQYQRAVDLPLAEFGTAVVTQLVTLAEENDIDPTQASLVLTGVYYSKLLEELDATRYGSPEAIQRGIIPNLYGFGQIVRAPLLSRAQPELGGFISLPQALGVGMRYLQPQSPGVYEETGQAYDDDSGILFGIRRFGEAATGKNHLAVEALYGAKQIDRKVLIRLKAG
ncbi:MAG: hypothetical protein M0Q49_01925 [Porticoccaceae bacterium]|nr:hypothetical protein [Porticoccaceae bacterium]